jgi:hypothetical protein
MIRIIPQFRTPYPASSSSRATGQASARRALLVAAFALAPAALAVGSEFYASPAGTPSGDGSIANPWTLSVALAQPDTVKPGDTIWLRGGTYSGTFTSALTGTSSAPIIVRQYPGESATIDGGNSGGMPILVIDGAYTWYWGFEVMSSDPNRVSLQSTSWPSDIGRGEGIVISQTAGSGVGTKFIDLVIHDTRQGVSFWKEAIDSEIYGCVIYYNGWQAPDDAHGHGIYAQNETGTKRIVDTILAQQFGVGFHGYGSSGAFLNNIYLEGNTAFDNGKLTSFWQRNTLVGGETPANNPTLISNFLYYPNGPRPYTALKLGYGQPCTNLVMTGNYVANNSEFGCAGMAIAGNTFYGAISGLDKAQFPDNTYTTQRPAANAIFVRPNVYELGRANITIYNWTLQSSVDVDLTGIAYQGNTFQIRNAQDFFGPPVVSGTYNGGAVSIPMSGLSVATPVGWTAPDPTGPEFNAFVLLSLPGPYDFFDVGPANPFRDAITKIASNGITAGCGGGNFCPDATVMRDQMAVFLLKGEHGSAFAPPPATGSVFTDVPAAAFAADWIEQAYAEGIASGCGSGQYCPRSPVSRAQMAVLLLKSKLGASYIPPPATGTVFSDVPADAFAAAWIEDLSTRGITAGCGGGNFCPASTVSRGQMSAFLVRTFGLQ